MLLNKKVSIWHFIKEIKLDIIFILLFSILMGALDSTAMLRKISIPLNITALLGTSVSILLAFRTSQSYERWWEARIIWGAIVNDSRSFIRLLINFLPENDSAIKEFTQRQIIWVHALGQALRKQAFSEQVSQYLNQHQISAQNIPNAILDRHSIQLKEVVTSKNLTDFQRIQLNEAIIKLCDSMGKCERLKTTVFPRSYSFLIHTLIYVFTVMLPFGIDDSLLFIEIAVTFLVPIIFIAIEKTAIVMQDPFENRPVDTPVTSIAQTIEINLREMIGEKNVPPKKPNDLYYEM